MNESGEQHRSLKVETIQCVPYGGALDFSQARVELEKSRVWKGESG